MPHDVSIVVVSDYKAGDDKAWNDMRETLRALGEQDYAGSVEVLLVEEERFGNVLPPDLLDILPGLKLHLVEAQSSYDLGNQGVAAASADLAVLLDADCVPDRGWLGSFMAAAAAVPEAAVISGHTRYPGDSLAERALALLGRAYVDAGGRGPTKHISNNNAGFRRAAFLEHPLPLDAGVYASRLQAEALLRAGHALYFEPGMSVVHDFEGWAMERDVRRYTGWGLVTMRRIDPRMPHGWMVRLGLAGLPLMALGRLVQSLAISTLRYSSYGLRVRHLPYVWATAAYVHALEVPGMLLALRGRPVGETVYR